MGLCQKVCSEIRFRAKSLETAILEVMGFGLVTGAETLRATYVHPAVGLNGFISESYGLPQREALMERADTPLLYGALQHGGDIFEGYLYPFAMYNALTVLFPRTSENFRMGVSLVTANLIILGAESGLFTGGKPDFLDVPAGVAGSLLYLGAHYLSRRLIQRRDERVLEEG